MTKEKIMEAATHLFAAKGLEAVSVRELAKKAQSNVAAISYYFDGKDGLYKAILEKEIFPVFQAIQLADVCAVELCPIRHIRLFAGQLTQIYLERPLIIRFINNEMYFPTKYGEPMIADLLSRIFYVIKRELIEGVRARILREDFNADYLAIALVGVITVDFYNRSLLNQVSSMSEGADNDFIMQAIEMYLHRIKV